MQHNIEVDYIGLKQRQRLTCYTCGVTIVQQPYMEFSEWQEKVDDFCEKHPREL